jgi:predicted dehydrogenase
MAPIKYGQIGVGHAHATKIAVYRQSPDYEVVGVVEPDPQLRRRAENHPAYRDLPFMTEEQLLNVPGLKVVGIETRVRDLLDAAETCVNAGLHIHLDKPGGESLPQFRGVLNSAASKHLAVQMGYMFRYNPGVVMLRDFLRKGWLGEPFEVHAVISKVIDPATRKELGEYAGGIMFELGCHVIDLVVGVLGRPDEVAPFRQKVSPLDDGLIDNMLAVFTYPRALASVKSSGLEVEGFGRRHLVVCGTEGTFHVEPLDNPSARVALSAPRGKYRKGYQDVSLPKYTRYVDDAADLAKIVRGEKESEFSYDHDYHVQETVLKASGLPLEP